MDKPPQIDTTFEDALRLAVDRHITAEAMEVEKEQAVQRFDAHMETARARLADLRARAQAYNRRGGFIYRGHIVLIQQDGLIIISDATEIEEEEGSDER